MRASKLSYYLHLSDENTVKAFKASAHSHATADIDKKYIREFVFPLLSDTHLDNLKANKEFGLEDDNRKEMLASLEKNLYCGDVTLGGFLSKFTKVKNALNFTNDIIQEALLIAYTLSKLEQGCDVLEPRNNILPGGPLKGIKTYNENDPMLIGTDKLKGLIDSSIKQDEIDEERQQIIKKMNQEGKKYERGDKTDVRLLSQAIDRLRIKKLYENEGYDKVQTELEAYYADKKYMNRPEFKSDVSHLTMSEDTVYDLLKPIMDNTLYANMKGIAKGLELAEERGFKKTISISYTATTVKGHFPRETNATPVTRYVNEMAKAGFNLSVDYAAQETGWDPKKNAAELLSSALQRYENPNKAANTAYHCGEDSNNKEQADKQVQNILKLSTLAIVKEIKGKTKEETVAIWKQVLASPSLTKILSDSLLHNKYKGGKVELKEPKRGWLESYSSFQKRKEQFASYRATYKKAKELFNGELPYISDDQITGVFDKNNPHACHVGIGHSIHADYGFEKNPDGTYKKNFLDEKKVYELVHKEETTTYKLFKQTGSRIEYSPRSNCECGALIAQKVVDDLQAYFQDKAEAHTDTTVQKWQKKANRFLQWGKKNITNVFYNETEYEKSVNKLITNFKQRADEYISQNSEYGNLLRNQSMTAEQKNAKLSSELLKMSKPLLKMLITELRKDNDILMKSLQLMGINLTIDTDDAGFFGGTIQEMYKMMSVTFLEAMILSLNTANVAFVPSRKVREEILQIAEDSVKELSQAHLDDDSQAKSTDAQKEKVTEQLSEEEVKSLINKDVEIDEKKLVGEEIVKYVFGKIEKNRKSRLERKGNKANA